MYAIVVGIDGALDESQKRNVHFRVCYGDKQCREYLFISALPLTVWSTNHGLVKSAQWLFSYCWEGGKGTS